MALPCEMRPCFHLPAYLEQAATRNDAYRPRRILSYSSRSVFSASGRKNRPMETSECCQLTRYGFRGAEKSTSQKLLACHSVQFSLTVIALGENNVDLHIGWDRDHPGVSEIQAHQFG